MMAANLGQTGGKGSGYGAMMIITALASMVFTETAQAQEQTLPPRQRQTTEAEAQTFDIAPQPLIDAMAQFGRRSGMQISVDSALIEGIASPGVRGAMAPEQALSRLLAGTGITWRLTGKNTAVLQRVPTENGAMTLGPVTVEGTAGTQEGVYDQARTEGGTSYTTPLTTVGKTATAIKDIPQSISVVTRQMMDDRNITTLDEAMKQVTGITAVKYDGSGMRTQFQSRGYEIDTVQLDGVATSWDVNGGDSFDAALYDRIEVLRGPAGLYQSGGEPGGTINLARKRALDHWSFGGEAGIGSWNAYRGVTDITGPLVQSGKLRARIVGVVDDRESFVDVVNSDKKTAYGTLEADLTDATTLSVGMTSQKTNATQNYGLSAYADGRLLDVDRSTFVGANWNSQKRDTLEEFAELQHRLDNGGEIKLSTRHFDYKNTEIGAWSDGAVDPSTRNFPAVAYANWITKEEWSWDGHVSTPIRFGGLTHNLLWGADYRTETQDSTWQVGSVNDLNIYSVNHHIAYPAFTTSWSPSRTDTEQWGGYGQARIKPGVDWLTLVAGGRMSWWNTRSEELWTAATTKYGTHGEFTPYAGLVWEAWKQVSLYASYTEIFKPQSEKNSSGEILAPRTGGAYEIGTKGSFLNDQLNTHLAVFRMEDRNRAVAITGCTGDNCYQAAGKVLSRGAEAEISGSPLPNWDVSAGYSFVVTEYLTGDDKGKTFSTNTPRHSVNLWAKYTFPEGSPFYRFNLGGGVKAVSSFYGESSGVRWIQGGYAVADIQAGYAFTDNLNATLSVTNLLDEKYYEKVTDGADRQNYYGAPRGVMLTMRAKY